MADTWKQNKQDLFSLFSPHKNSSLLAQLIHTANVYKDKHLKMILFLL